MRKISLLLVALAFASSIVFFWSKEASAPADQTELESQPVQNQQDITEKVKAYLNSKQSPLSDDEVDLLVEQKHWKLLVAIMAIESQYGKRQLRYNLFGIGGDSVYRHYNNFSESIIDADSLITRWQNKGRWLTVSDMNCSYVVPCNQNWEHVVNKILQDIDSF